MKFNLKILLLMFNLYFIKIKYLHLYN